jgi:hypothetical protein
MFILSTLCIAQTSYLTLSASKDAMIREYNGIGDGNNYGTTPYLNMHAWTNGGIPVTHRSLIDFDLSTPTLLSPKIIDFRGNKLTTKPKNIRYRSYFKK